MWTFRVEGHVVLGGDEGEDEDKYGGYKDVNNSRGWRKYENRINRAFHFSFFHSFNLNFFSPNEGLGFF